MKKLTTRMILLVLAMALLCTVAFAADPEIGNTGVEPLEMPLGYSAKFYDASDNEITANTQGVYEGAKKIELTINETIAGSYELIYVVKGDEATAPTEENLKFIDQSTGTGDKLMVMVYPSEMDEGTYTIVRSNDQGVTAEAIYKFQVKAAATPEYKLGDANLDGAVNIQDAVAVLEYCVGSRTLEGNAKLAADANKDGAINIQDAVAILEYCVGSRVLE